MKYKQIKDMQASAIGFGCWAIGGTWNNVTDENSIRTIHAAIDEGINFFDVAPVYGKGHAESVLGQALSGISRDKVIIASKCGLPWDPADPNKKTRKDLSHNSIVFEVEQSLKRLGTDYLDLYQVHWPDPNTPIDETAHALKILKEQGKIRHIGVSNYSLDMIEQMQSVVEVATVQGLYNLIEQNPDHYHNIPLQYRTRDEMLPYCQQHDMKYLPYSPLMQGLLTGTFKAQHNFDDKDDRRNNPKLNGELFKDIYFPCAMALKTLADSAGLPLSHLAIHWMVNQESIGSVIAGAHTVNQAKENARFLQSDVSEILLHEAESIVAKWIA
ncbi:aldo/keto reductase [Vibrio sp. 10N.261.51.F12]|uniref:aldo/keto reductase n=1 Tax=Vibrio sp. 10N.261.51.F12 TaxID=3229679 RepID=UPI00355196EE